MAITNKGHKVKPASVAVEEKATKPAGKVDLKQEGLSIYYSMSPEEVEKLGSKSGDLEFVKLITNPFFNVSRKLKDGSVIKGEETVGAILKNLGKEPITVKTIPNKSYEVMDADWDNVSERVVQPGEEFQLNSLEVAELLTRPEYGGRITGGGKEVIYTTQTPKDPTVIPTTKLRIKDGSVKDHSISIGYVGEDGSKVVKPEFQEKFAIFATRGARKRAISGTSKKPKVNAAGLAVQALFKQKLAGAGK
jgi:hypothetical protein